MNSKIVYWFKSPVGMCMVQKIGGNLWEAFGLALQIIIIIIIIIINMINNNNNNDDDKRYLYSAISVSSYHFTIH